jgi:crotonobetaine/carnitine-CoA ligase
MPSLDRSGGEPCVISELIDRNADERPGETAVIFPGLESWTYGELRQKVRARAAGLQALGVMQDEPVLTWLPNGPHAVVDFLALNYLGAVYVPINIAYRGAVLEHVVANSGARLMIAHGTLAERLAEVSLARLERVVVVGPERPDLAGVELIGEEALSAPGEELQPPARPPRPWDTHMVIHTSGTTGPAKGVLCSYRHTATAALQCRNVGPGDRNLTTTPMSHVTGPCALQWALLHGGSCVMAESFRTQDFWEIVRRYGITTTGLLGAMVRFLLSQPPSPEDRNHGLRSVIIAPFDEAALEFGRRFGVDVYTLFSMTEVSTPLFAGPNPTVVGACGTVRAGVEARLVDANDIEVPDGRTGELVLRTDEPWALSHGYLNDPEATARAWRNGWFHTGDLFRRDAEGHYFFVDRAKDALRRRGENISSFEVESAVLLHPKVREAAVVAVPADVGEDDVMAVVTLEPGAAFDPAELLDFLRPRLAHFMLPRYVRVAPALPRTATHKVEKHRLRAEGLTSDTWDREAAGLHIRRERLDPR